MALKRYVTEMGMGVDVHGRDYTNAARRAVSDAIRHSSLHFFQATNKSREDMRITLIIAVTEPSAVDSKAVAAELPYGSSRLKSGRVAWKCPMKLATMQSLLQMLLSWYVSRNN